MYFGGMRWVAGVDTNWTCKPLKMDSPSRKIYANSVRCVGVMPL